MHFSDHPLSRLSAINAILVIFMTHNVSISVSRYLYLESFIFVFEEVFLFDGDRYIHKQTSSSTLRPTILGLLAVISETVCDGMFQGIIKGSLNRFPDFFFVWALLLIVHTWNSSPLRNNLLQLQCTCCTVPTTSGRPHGSPLVWVCQWPLSSPQLSHNNSFWASRITKSHREQGLDYREAEELSWCPSCSNSLWQGWSCGLVYCSGRNATDPIWTVLASSLGISSWTPLKPQHSNLNTNPIPLANRLWWINFLTPATPLIIPHRLPAFLESRMRLKNGCSIHARCFKSSLNHSIRFCGIFCKFKTEFYCISFF